MACTDYNPFHEYLCFSDSISKSKAAMDMGPNPPNGTRITSLAHSMSNGRFTDKLLQEDIAVENGSGSLFLCSNFDALDLESGLSCTFSSGTDDVMEKLLSSDKDESDVFRNNFLQHDYPLLEKFQELDNVSSSDDLPIECMHSNSFDRLIQTSNRPLNNTAPSISDKFSYKSKMSCVSPNDSNSVTWSCFSTNSFLKNDGSFGFRGSDSHLEVPAAVMKKKPQRAVIFPNGSDTQFDQLGSASVMNRRTGNTSLILLSSSDAGQVSEPHPILGRWSKDRSFADNLMEGEVVNEGFDGGNVSLAVGQPWSQRNSNSFQKRIIELVHPAECGKSSTDLPNSTFGAMNTESYFSNDSKSSSFRSNPRFQWQDLTVPNDNGCNNGLSCQSIIPNASSFSPLEKNHFKCRESDFNFIPDNGSFVYPEGCHHSCSHSDRNETSSLTGNLFHDLNICSRSDFQDLTLLMWDLLKARGGSHSEGEQISLNFRQPRNGEGTSCAFCKRNGETLEFYSTHVVKDYRGKVICPILRKYVCPLCGSTGDKAHTIRHCPLYSDNLINTAFDTFTTKRSSCGRRSRNNP